MHIDFLCLACPSKFTIRGDFMEKRKNVICPSCGLEMSKVLVDNLREIVKLNKKLYADMKAEEGNKQPDGRPDRITARITY